MMRPIVIGVCGGSCSGKTTVCENIEALFPNNINTIKQDSYYKGGNENTDFDNPSSLEFEYMVSQLKNSIQGNPIHVPIYDFTTHSRKEETIYMEPKKIILIDGILIYTVPELLELCDLRIYVNADLDTRYKRRRDRDIKERGRNIAEVDMRWTRDVKPNHMKFVEPSKRHAHIIINNDVENTDDDLKRMVQIRLIASFIREHLAK